MHLSRKLSLAIFTAIAVIGIIVDRVVKSWAASSLVLNDAAGGPDFGLFKMMLVHNEGAAFSMGEGHTAVFIGLAVVIVGAIVFGMLAIKEHNALDVVALGLIAGGAVGNVIDRVVDGYVTDMICLTFIDFPVFNVADICVVVGVILFIVYVLIFMDFEEEDAVVAAKTRTSKKGRSGQMNKKLIAQREAYNDKRKKDLRDARKAMEAKEKEEKAKRMAKLEAKQGKKARK